jgi:hypothetical protein
MILSPVGCDAYIQHTNTIFLDRGCFDLSSPSLHKHPHANSNICLGNSIASEGGSEYHPWESCPAHHKFSRFGCRNRVMWVWIDTAVRIQRNKSTLKQEPFRRPTHGKYSLLLSYSSIMKADTSGLALLKYSVKNSRSKTVFHFL